jgi:hypothetical protein
MCDTAILEKSDFTVICSNLSTLVGLIEVGLNIRRFDRATQEGPLSGPICYSVTGWRVFSYSQPLQISSARPKLFLSDKAGRIKAEPKHCKIRSIFVIFVRMHLLLWEQNYELHSTPKSL